MELGKLTPEQRLAYSREIARASAERDRCIRSLGLDQTEPADLWQSLYSPQQTEPPPPAEPDPEPPAPGETAVRPSSGPSEGVNGEGGQP